MTITNPRKEILALAYTYMERTGLAISTVSKKAMNDGKRLEKIEAGGDFGMALYERARAWFLKNTPPDKQGKSSKKINKS